MLGTTEIRHFLFPGEGVEASTIEYGPIEIYLVGFEGAGLDPKVIAELTALTSSKLVRLLDFVIVSKDLDGVVTFAEPDQLPALWLEVHDLGAPGIAGDEVIEELAAVIEPGRSAALVVMELVYQRSLAQRAVEAGGTLLAYERVPAPVVNALMDVLAESAEE